MKAGDLRHRLIFQVKVVTQNSVGENVEVWDDTPASFEVRGAFEPLGSREFPIAHKRHAETTARFRIRYRAGIDPGTHRILHAGRIWNIQPPIEVGGKPFELHIEASEIV